MTCDSHSGTGLTGLTGFLSEYEKGKTLRLMPCPDAVPQE
jgi:hypothetical protein